MKTNKFVLLKADISTEIKNLERLQGELSHLLKNSNEPFSSVGIRAIGSILHDFYCGTERIMQRIAVNIDEDIPQGVDWHIRLLNKMAVEIPDIRPVVISETLKDNLKEYLRFRHLFRNVYGFELKWDKIKGIAMNLDQVWLELKANLDELICFLNTLIEETNNV